MRGALPNQQLDGSVEPASRSWFVRFAAAIAHLSGRPGAFVLAFAVVIVWAITGPVFHFSDTWQLIINTGTTIVTFLMVFLIQNTQNRDTLALQLKLDELILATKDARNEFVALEECSEEELEIRHAEERESAQRADQVADTDRL